MTLIKGKSPTINEIKEEQCKQVAESIFRFPAKHLFHSKYIKKLLTLIKPNEFIKDLDTRIQAQVSIIDSVCRSQTKS